MGTVVQHAQECTQAVIVHDPHVVHVNTAAGLLARHSRRCRGVGEVAFTPRNFLVILGNIGGAVSDDTRYRWLRVAIARMNGR